MLDNHKIKWHQNTHFKYFKQSGRLAQYASRKTTLGDLDESMVSEDMSELELYLLKSQEMMTVRGKVSVVKCHNASLCFNNKKSRISGRRIKIYFFRMT